MVRFMIEVSGSRTGGGIARLAVVAMVWFLSLGVAVWAGVHWARESPARTSLDIAESKAQRHSEPTETFSPTIIAAPGAALDTAELRKIIHDELAQQLADLRRAPLDNDAPETLQDPKGVSPELQARGEEASRFVERAVSSGRWTSEERQRFSTVTMGLAPPTVIELQRKVNIAINRGQLAVIDNYPPFGPPLPP
jgi:hypothetical protein